MPYKPRLSSEHNISKLTLQMEPLHGQNERTVKQEVSAHFNLTAMTRLFTSRSEQGLLEPAGVQCTPAWQANFRNGLRTMVRDLEGSLLRQTSLIRESVGRILDCIGRCGQRRWPGRSYQPANKWNRRKREAVPAVSENASASNPARNVCIPCCTSSEWASTTNRTPLR